MAGKTKIDERREREAYDKAHPWQPVSTCVVNDGAVLEVMLPNMETMGTRRFFLGEDDIFYEIDPPRKLWMPGPMNWRLTDPPAKLSPAKRAEIIAQANKRDW